MACCEGSYKHNEGYDQQVIKTSPYAVYIDTRSASICPTPEKFGEPGRKKSSSTSRQYECKARGKRGTNRGIVELPSGMISTMISKSADKTIEMLFPNATRALRASLGVAKTRMDMGSMWTQGMARDCRSCKNYIWTVR